MHALCNIRCLDECMLLYINFKCFFSGLNASLSSHAWQVNCAVANAGSFSLCWWEGRVVWWESSSSSMCCCASGGRGCWLRHVEAAAAFAPPGLGVVLGGVRRRPWRDRDVHRPARGARAAPRCATWRMRPWPHQPPSSHCHHRGLGPLPTPPPPPPLRSHDFATRRKLVRRRSAFLIDRPGPAHLSEGELR